MLRILLMVDVALAACTPSPQEAAMPNASSVQRTNLKAPSMAMPENRNPDASDAIRQSTGNPAHAAEGPIPESVSAAGVLARPMPVDSAAEALGRRTLSTAFVRVGPDGHLTVELHGGHILILRDVVLRSKDYCGVQASGDQPGARYCGGYSEIAAARPGSALVAIEPDTAASDSVSPGRISPQGR